MKNTNEKKGLVRSVKEHWKTPAEGRYVPLREIAAYSGRRNRRKISDQYRLDDRPFRHKFACRLGTRP